MNRIRFCFILLLITFTESYSFYQEQIIYKMIDSTSLNMSIFKPGNMDSTHKYPAMIFFFGGGWNEGNMKQFEPHARYFSQRGMVCVLVDYRVKGRQGTSPFESLKDAKSAIRYLRENAAMYSIDANRIVASGGSAGGHLAAATAVIADYNESTDNLSVSCKPNALVLFNPVIDNGPNGYGYERIGDSYKSFSPMHNLVKGTPPTIILSGTKDNLVPVQTLESYQKKMKKVKSRCDLYLYMGQPHGFFNYRNLEYYKKTVAEVDRFLQSIGYLTKEPFIPIE